MEQENDALHAAESTMTEEEKARRRSRLNDIVALTVALLITFLAVYRVKDNNVLRVMQVVQVNKIDALTEYQASTTREVVAGVTADQLQLLAQTASPDERATYQRQYTAYRRVENQQIQERREALSQANRADRAYDRLTLQHDQFDLADAMISIAIALFAITALLQKPWLFWVALVPAVFGIFMGLAGFFEWNIHPERLARIFQVDFDHVTQSLVQILS